MKKYKLLDITMIGVAVCVFVFIAIIVIIDLSKPAENTERTNVSATLQEQEEYFNTMQRLIVYNTKSNTIVCTVEGYLTTDFLKDSSDLIVYCKTTAETYKKNSIHLNDDIIYFIEDITGTSTDPYHYRFILNEPKETETSGNS